MTVGSFSVSKSQSAKGSSSNSVMLLRLVVPCQMESKTVGSFSVSKSQSAKGSSSNSGMLLRLAVPCRMESKALCATPPGLRQWIESSSEPSEPPRSGASKFS